MLKPWKYHDAISGNELEISLSDLYLTFRVNERCYYFRTDDGRFDGTSTDLEIKTFLDLSPIRGQPLQLSCDRPA